MPTEKNSLAVFPESTEKQTIRVAIRYHHDGRPDHVACCPDRWMVVRRWLPRRAESHAAPEIGRSAPAGISASAARSAGVPPRVKHLPLRSYPGRAGEERNHRGGRGPARVLVQTDERYRGDDFVVERQVQRQSASRHLLRDLLAVREPTGHGETRGQVIPADSLDGRSLLRDRDQRQQRWFGSLRSGVGGRQSCQSESHSDHDESRRREDRQDRRQGRCRRIHVHSPGRLQGDVVAGRTRLRQQSAPARNCTRRLATKCSSIRR